MNTLYININGEDIQSKDGLTVVGRKEDSIETAFFYELGYAIKSGVQSPGINDVSLRKLVEEFKKECPDVFEEEISSQWQHIKYLMLVENRCGSFTFAIPQGLLSWLSGRPAVYLEIAKSLQQRNRAVSISLDRIYKESVDLILGNIIPGTYEHLVVNDEMVTQNSNIIIKIKENYKGANFVPFGEWRKENPFHSDSEKQPSSSLYEEIDDFHNGMARVKRNGKYGFVNLSGREVVTCKYTEAEVFSEGLASVKTKGNGRTDFIDTDGNVVFTLPFGVDAESTFKNGLCAIRNRNGCGYVDMTGNIVIDCEYLFAHDFSDDGIALVERDSFHYLYINREGKMAFDQPTYFKKGTDFKFGRAIVETYNGESHVLDINGQSDEDFLCLNGTRDGLTCDINHMDDMGFVFINIRGYSEVEKRYVSAKSWVDLNNHDRFGVIDLDERHCYLGGDFSKESLMEIYEKGTGRKSFINVKGDTVLQNFDDYGDFKEGLCPAKRDGGWGFVDTRDNEVIECQFDEAHSFSNGMAAVKKNNLWGFIDVDGEIIVPCQYSYVHDFKEERAVVFKNGVCGIIDLEGNAIL